MIILPALLTTIIEAASTVLTPLFAYGVKKASENALDNLMDDLDLTDEQKRIARDAGTKVVGKGFDYISNTEIFHPPF